VHARPAAVPYGSGLSMDAVAAQEEERERVMAADEAMAAALQDEEDRETERIRCTLLCVL
jgi:hypothetical protein